jgi:hypothetical protein
MMRITGSWRRRQGRLVRVLSLTPILLLVLTVGIGDGLPVAWGQPPDSVTPPSATPTVTIYVEAIDWLNVRYGPHAFQARQTPDAPCTIARQAHQWQALYAHHHFTLRLPTTPPTLGQALRWMAQLGGFMAHRGDGHPGVTVLWRGWSRLQRPPLATFSSSSSCA